MSEKYETVVQMLNAWWGGAATTIIAAIVGGLAYLGPRGAEVLFMRIIASRFPNP